MPFKRPLGATDSENQSPPHFVRPLQDKRVLVGGSTVLECQIEGVPEPAIKWLKDGQNISKCPDYQLSSEGSRYKLSIAQISENDSGRFTIQASNVAGSKTSSCTLIVAPAPSPVMGGNFNVAPSPAPPATPVGPAAPMFMKPLQPQPLKIGGTAMLECRVIGAPAPDVAWYKDGQPLADSFRYKVENDAESGICCLIISMMFAEDVGEYTCKATNQHGSPETSAQVMHKDKYEDWLSEEQKKITREKKLTMMSEMETAIGQQRPKKVKAAFYGSKTQQRIEQQIETRFSDVESSSDMPWVSESETEPELAAMDSPSTGHVPASAPGFTAQLRSQRLAEGSDVILQAAVTGSPKPRIYWFKDGQPLSPNAGQRYQFTYKGSMVVLKIKMGFPEDSGRYTLVAENQHGRKQSDAEVQVTPFGDQSLQRHQHQQQQYTQQQSQSHVLRQQHQQSTTMQYSSSQQTQQQSGPVVGYRTPSRGQDISPVRRTPQPFRDEGPRNQVVQPQIARNDTRPPQFVKAPSSKTVRPGETAQFDVKISAAPHPTVDWVLGDGQKLHASSKYEMSGNQQDGYYSLKIHNCQTSDATDLVCLASNQAGQVRARCQLNVANQAATPAPHMVENFQAVTVKEGDSLTLFCKAAGDGVSMQWYKDDIPQDLFTSRFKIEVKETESTLQIVNARMDDTGWYQCNASNASGTTSLRGRVVVQPKEQLPPREQVQPEGGGIFKQEFRLATSQQTKQVSLKHTEQRSPQPRPVERQPTHEHPRFTTELKAMNLLDGQPARLECRYTPVNDPQLRIIWLHNNQPLQASSRMTSEFDFGFSVLEINPISTHDAGTYTCLAVNPAGEARNTAQINVTSANAISTQSEHPGALHQITAMEHRRQHLYSAVTDEVTSNAEQPRFLTELQPLQAFEGKGVHFEAKLTPSNDPNLLVEWFKDGSRFRILHDFGYVALDITHTIPEDSGTYTCRAINRTSTAETSTTLAVQAKKSVHADHHYVAYEDNMFQHQQENNPGKFAASPSFMKQPKDCRVLEGNRAHLEARVAPSDDSTLIVQWMKDGKPLQMANRVQIFHDFGYVSLTLHPALPQDTGMYTCVLKNRMGQAEASAVIRCDSREPRAHVSSETQNQEALPQLLYLERKKIRIGPEELVRPEEDQSLQIPKVVKPMQAEIMGTEGQPVHMECRVTPTNDPKMRIEWYKDGRVLPAAHRFRPMYDFGYVALDILYAYAEDSGLYAVVAKNELGNAQTECELYVQPQKSVYTQAHHPDGYDKLRQLEMQRRHGQDDDLEPVTKAAPSFKGELSDKQLREGANLHMELKLFPQRDPTMKVEWYLNGRPLLTGSRIKTVNDFGFVTCDIRGLIAEDSGVYACRAVNSLGEALAECRVHVMERSNIISDTVNSESLGKIQYLESHERRGGRREHDDAPLTNEPPTFTRELPRGPKQIPESAPLHLECQVAPVNDNSMQIEWYRNGRPVPHGHRFRTFTDFGFVSLDILNFYAEDNGTYTCIARNANGEATSQCDVHCQELTGVLGDTQHPDSVARIHQLEGRRPQRGPEQEAAKQTPEFTRPLNDPGEIREGRPVHLECQVIPTDDNTLKIEWYKDNKPINAGHRFQMSHDFGFCTLNILYANAEDSGVYTCLAKNAIGEAFTQVRITCAGGRSMYTETMHPQSLTRIQQLEKPKPKAKEPEEDPSGPPRFVVPLPAELEKLREAQTLHLECQVTPSDDPTMKILWFRDDEELRASHRFAMTHDFGYVALDVLHVYPEDTGVFMCRAISSSGQAESKCNLHCIQRKDIFTETQHPESWRRIRELENSRRAKPTEQEREKMAPVFTEDLICPEQVKEGQAVHMECILQPIDDPTIQIEWFLNGEPLMMGSRIRTMHDFGYVALEIYHIHPEDDGVYTCRATNELGSAETSAKLLCTGKKTIYSDTQHPASLARIRQLEQRPGQRPPTPEQKYPPPAFTQPLPELDVLNEGETLRLQCRLEPANDPSLAVTWLKNGQALPQGSRFMPARNFDLVTLDILTVYAEDSGIYTCVARSAFGEAAVSSTVRCTSAGAMLLDTLHQESWRRIQEIEDRPKAERSSVQDADVFPPRFTVNLPENLGEIQEGTPVHMECQVEPISDPKLQITWYWNDKPLANAHRFRLTQDFGYVALDILYAFAQDTGVWKVVAKNELGQAETQCQFRVIGKGGIMDSTQHPDSWQRIQELERPRIKQDVGPDQKKGQPMFLEQIPPLHRVEGQPAHFETRVQPVDDPKLEITWLKDGKPLSFSNRISNTLDFGYVALDFAHVNIQDPGMYTCRATNAEGYAEVQTQLIIDDRGSLLMDTMHPESLARINELEAPRRGGPDRSEGTPEPPVFTQQMNSCNNLVEGQPAHFEALVSPITDPNLRIEWLHNGHPLAASSRRTMRHDFGLVTLDMHYVLPEDEGVYECRATNRVGQDTTQGELRCSARDSIYGDTMHEASWQRIREIEATRPNEPDAVQQVYAKPSFTQPLSSVNDAQESSEALLEARVIPVNDPHLKLEWFFNEKPLSFSNRISVTSDFGYVALRLNPVYTQDAGTYMCRASNEHGEAVSTALVTVLGGDSIQRQSLHPESLKQVQVLEGIDKNARPAVAEQEFERPNFIKPLENLDNVGESAQAHLECHYEPKGDPTMTVEWLFNGLPLQNASRFHTENDFGVAVLDIVHVLVQDSGVYTCRARNSHGEATTSCTVKVNGYEVLQLESQHPQSWQKIQDLERPVQHQEQETVREKVKPYFVEPPQSLESVLEGSPLKLVARYQPSKDNTMKVQWERNGEPIAAGQLVRTSDNLGVATLDITNAYAHNSGVYTIKIENEHGQAAASASVKVVDANGAVLTRGDVLSDTQHAESWQQIQKIEMGKTKAEAPTTMPFGPPSIRAHLSDVQCAEGDPAHFECQIDPAADGSLIYEWFRNGQPLTHGSKFKITNEFGFCVLDLAHTNPEDSGVYQCKVTSKTGEAVASATLKCDGSAGIITDTTHQASVAKIAELEKPKAGEPDAPPQVFDCPAFVTPLQDVGPLQEGQPAHFEATVTPTNDPNMKAEWIINGNVVPTSSRVRMINDFGYLMMDIAHVELRDAGDWQLRVYNAAGEAVSVGALTVIESSTLLEDTQHPDSLAKIKQIEAPKPGQQELHAASPAPPVFIKQLFINGEVEEGDSVHLEAQVMPITDPTIRIEWLHNGQPLRTGSRFRQIGEFGFCVLDILRIVPDDSGIYTCRATNAHGTAETSLEISCTGRSGLILASQVKATKAQAIADLEEKLHSKPQEHEMQLQKVPPVFVEPLRDTPSLKEGESAYFAARYTPNNDPQIKVEWFVNGRPLKTGARVKTISDFGMAILEINPVYPEDSGEYICRASNSQGEATTSGKMTCGSKSSLILESQLTGRMAGAQDSIRKIETRPLAPPDGPSEQYGPPKFVSSPENNMSLKEGMLAHIQCQAEPVRDPKLKIEWFHNGEPIIHSNRIRSMFDFGFVVLEMTPVEPQDNGTWECRATNEHGTASCECEIAVEPGSGVVYDWQRPPDRRNQVQQLEDWLTRPKDGPADKDANYPAPSFTIQLANSGEIVEGQPAHFECQVEPMADPSLRIEWLHNDQPIPYSARMQTHHNFGFAVLDISYCILEDNGVYKCRAVNKAGEASTACNLRVQSIEDVEQPTIITPLLANIDKLVEGDAVHMECRVGPINDSRLKVEWFFNGETMPTSSRVKTVFDFGFAALDILYAHSEDTGKYECRASIADVVVVTECNVQVSSRPDIVFQRQVPLRSTMDLQRYLKQFTSNEVALTEADMYQDGQNRKPEFKVAMTEQNIEEGGFARLEAQLAPINDPYMKLEWFVNGEPVMMGHRFRSTLESGFGALDLLYALPTDSGEYVMQATNKHGSTICKTQINCTSKSRVIKGSQIPQGMKVKTLKDTDDKADLYWSKNEEAKEPEKVKCPPVFTIVPRNQQSDEAEPARFECAVYGFPKPKVTWFHNGKMVVPGLRYKVNYDGMHYLTIPSCRPSDAGDILVTARTFMGEVQSKCNLDVRPSNQFRDMALKPTKLFSDDERQQRDAGWQKELMGTLGDHFKKVRGADLATLKRIERDRPEPPPMETKELIQRWTIPRDEKFFEKVISAERDRPPVEPLQANWPNALKPAQPSKWQWKEDKIEAVKLKSVPTRERPAELPEEVKFNSLSHVTRDDKNYGKPLEFSTPVPRDKVALKKVKAKAAPEQNIPERTPSERQPAPKTTTKEEPKAPKQAKTKPTVVKPDASRDQISSSQPMETGSSESDDVTDTTVISKKAREAAKLPSASPARKKRPSTDQLMSPTEDTKEVVQLKSRKQTETNKSKKETDKPKEKRQHQAPAEPDTKEQVQLKPVKRKDNEKVEKPIAEKADKPIAEKADKPIAEKADKPIAEKADKPIVHKADKPIVGKADKPIAKKADKPIAEKADKPIAEKADKPIAEKADKPIVHKADKPIVGKADKPIAEKADKPIAEKADKPIAEKADKPIAEQADKPIVGKADKPIAEKADKPIAEKADKPIVGKADKQITEKAEKPIAENADKPIVEKAEKPIVQKADKPIVGKAEKPTVQKAEKPTVQKAEKPPIVEKAEKPTVETAEKRPQVETKEQENKVKDSVPKPDANKGVAKKRPDHPTEESPKMEKKIKKEQKTKTNDETTVKTAEQLRVTTKVKTVESGLTRQIVKSGMEDNAQSSDHENEVTHKTAQKKAPNVEMQLHPQLAVVGKPAKFNCSFSGDSPLTVTWSKDGHTLASTAEYQLQTDATTSSLTIPNATAEHAGTYTCRIDNVAGTNETAANLQVTDGQAVGDAPQFSKPLQAMQVVAGNPVQFDVLVASQPKSQVLWFKDGKAVSQDVRCKLLVDEGKHSLLLIEAMPSDEGIYECIARNNKGETRCRANLTITKPERSGSISQSVTSEASGVVQAGGSGSAPSFASQIEPVLTKEGAPATFLVQYRGKPEPVVKWYHNNEEIKKSKFFQIEKREGSSELTIQQCFAEDLGTYTCEVINDAGKASCSASLAFEAAPSRTITTKEVSRTTKTSLIDSKQIQPAPKAKPPTDGTPGFRESLEHAVVKVGVPVTLQAIVVGDPMPEVQWLHNGQPVQSDETRKISAQYNSVSLELTSVTDAHEGEYAIRLSNDKGSAECSAYLQIES